MAQSFTVKPAPPVPTPEPTILIEFTREELEQLRTRVFADLIWSSTGHRDFWAGLHDTARKGVEQILAARSK